MDFTLFLCCHVLRIALADVTLRGVPMCQDFSHFPPFFTSFCIGQISRQQHKDYHVLRDVFQSEDVRLLKEEMQTGLKYLEKVSNLRDECVMMFCVTCFRVKMFDCWRRRCRQDSSTLRRCPIWETSVLSCFAWRVSEWRCSTAEGGDADRTQVPWEGLQSERRVCYHVLRDVFQSEDVRLLKEEMQTGLKYLEKVSNLRDECVIMFCVTCFRVKMFDCWRRRCRQDSSTLRRSPIWETSVLSCFAWRVSEWRCSTAEGGDADRTQVPWEGLQSERRVCYHVLRDVFQSEDVRLLKEEMQTGLKYLEKVSNLRDECVIMFCVTCFRVKMFDCWRRRCRQDSSTLRRSPIWETSVLSCFAWRVSEWRCSTAEGGDADRTQVPWEGLQSERRVCYHVLRDVFQSEDVRLLKEEMQTGLKYLEKVSNLRDECVIMFCVTCFRVKMFDCWRRRCRQDSSTLRRSPIWETSVLSCFAWRVSEWRCSTAEGGDADRTQVPGEGVQSERRVCYHVLRDVFQSEDVRLLKEEMQTGLKYLEKVSNLRDECVIMFCVTCFRVKMFDCWRRRCRQDSSTLRRSPIWETSVLSCFAWRVSEWRCSTAEGGDADRTQVPGEGVQSERRVCYHVLRDVFQSEDVRLLKEEMQTGLKYLEKVSNLRDECVIMFCVTCFRVKMFDCWRRRCRQDSSTWRRCPIWETSVLSCFAWRVSEWRCSTAEGGDADRTQVPWEGLQSERRVCYHVLRDVFQSEDVRLLKEEMQTGLKYLEKVSNLRDECVMMFCVMCFRVKMFDCWRRRCRQDSSTLRRSPIWGTSVLWCFAWCVSEWRCSTAEGGDADRTQVPGEGLQSEGRVCSAGME